MDKSNLTLEEKRLKLIRKEWNKEKERLEEHEKRKLYMIAEYEKKRSQDQKKERSLQQRKSRSPQHRRSEEYDASSRFDKKELNKIKIKIYNRRTSTNKIESDINPDDIIIPRKKNEGSYPLSKREEMKAGGSKEIQTNELFRDNQSVQQSNGKEKAYIYRENFDNNRYSSDFRSNRSISRLSKYRDHRMNNNDKLDRSSLVKNNRDNNERCEDHSNSVGSIRDRSRLYRKSKSPLRQTRERRISNAESRYSSNRDSERLYQSNHPVSSELSRNSRCYNGYVPFPRPISMLGIHHPSPMVPPMIWPIVQQGMFPVPFSANPSHMLRYMHMPLPSPRLANFVRGPYWNPR